MERYAIAHNLIPELLILKNLPSAIKSFCDLIQKRHELKIELQILGQLNEPPRNFNHSVYRVVQELLHNVVKHAQTKRALLQITLHHQLLQITVEDNGIGFEQSGSTVGMGITNIRKRVEDLQGQLVYKSVPDKYTVVKLKFQLAKTSFMPIDIVIVDDHPLLIKGMNTLLQHYEDISISATYPDGSTLLKGFQNKQPDVLILDIQMPGLGGNALVSLLLTDYPKLRILVLTHMEHEYYVKTLINAGILGYVLKSSQEQVLMEGIRKVSRGKQFLDPIIKHYIEEINENAIGSPFLTQRELEVLRMIAEDYNSNQIAEQLFISKRTVDNHRINLLLKLGAKGSANLVKKAIELGLIV